MTRDWIEMAKREGESFHFRVERVILSKRTRYQRLEIADTVAHGRALFLDGNIQTAERDEFIYHESLVHPGLLCHPCPRRVLIVGGGDGASLREVLRHRTVEEVVMVDIDAEVIEAARTHMPGWSRGGFEDPRLTLIHEDARGYLENCGGCYDAAVLDLTEPLEGSPSCGLFSLEFYSLVHSRLAPRGVLVLQAESADYGVNDRHMAIRHTLSQLFPVVRGYHAHVPSYLEEWGFITACKDGARDPARMSVSRVDSLLSERVAGEMRYYDGLTHRRLFSPPLYERQQSCEEWPVLTDARPLAISVSTPATCP